MKLTVYIDGGARGNPGPAGCGAVIYQDGEVLLERGEYIGETTNNVAEYRAFLLGVGMAKELGASEVDVVSDSQLLVRQVLGQYKVKAAHLKPLHKQAKESLADFESYNVRHVMREDNVVADSLVNRAIDEKGAVS
jgi:ribonuclease HI